MVVRRVLAWFLQKQVEIQMRNLLEDLVGLEATMADKSPATGKNCSHFPNKRPDILFRVGDHLVIIVEINENCHVSYPVLECDIAKVSIQKSNSIVKRSC